MIKLSEMKEKEVVNIKNGVRMGIIYDFEMDLENGIVKAIIIPGPGKILGVFGRDNDLIINWEDIVQIGTDVILIDIDDLE